MAERWSGSDAPSLVQPLARVPLERWPKGTSVTVAARLTVAPGAEASGVALLGPGLLVIEAGELAVRGSGEAQVFQKSGDPVVPEVLVPAGTEPVLGPGDAVAFPAGTGALSLRNEGTELVVALAVVWIPSQDGVVLAPGNDQALNSDQSVQSPASLDMPVSSPAIPISRAALMRAMLPLTDGGHALDNPGITVTPLGSLGSLGAAQVVPGRVVVTLDWVMLAPGTSLPARPARGPVFLIVEVGSLGLIPVRETAWVRFPTSRQEAASAGIETNLAEGEAAFWDAGAVALLRGRHDTAGSALLLTISPADEGGEKAG